MATLTCPNCAAEVRPDDLICFTCGANLPRTVVRDDDSPAANTVMQEYLRPDDQRESPSRPPCSGFLFRPGTWKFQLAPPCYWAVIRRNPWWQQHSRAMRTSRGGMRR